MRGKKPCQHEHDLVSRISPVEKILFGHAFLQGLLGCFEFLHPCFGGVVHHSRLNGLHDICKSSLHIVQLGPHEIHGRGGLRLLGCDLVGDHPDGFGIVESVGDDVQHRLLQESLVDGLHVAGMKPLLVPADLPGVMFP